MADQTPDLAEALDAAVAAVDQTVFQDGQRPRASVVAIDIALQAAAPLLIAEGRRQILDELERALSELDGFYGVTQWIQRMRQEGEPCES